ARRRRRARMIARRPRTTAIVALALLATLDAACRSDRSRAAGGDASRRMSVCLYADPTTLDIRVQTTRNLRSVVGNIHHTLIAARGPDLDLVPQLATSWERIDPLTWRLHLRKGVSFTNGEPFNAEAVKYSIETQRAGRGGVRTYLTGITRVNPIDDYTVD